MENFESAKDYLKLEYETRKSRNRYYSMRSFALSLNLSSGALSEILNGKRKIGLNKAHEITESLKLEGKAKSVFINLAKKDLNRKSVTRISTKAINHRSFEIFEMISNPLCSIILASSELFNDKLDIQKLSSIIDYSKEEIESALNKLLELGLIEKEADKYIVSNDVFISPQDIPSQAIRAYHHRMLDKAKDALEEQDLKKRDIQGMSLAIDPQYVEEFKKDIRQFQKKIIKKYQKGNKTQLFHFQSALFEISKDLSELSPEGADNENN